MEHVLVVDDRADICAIVQTALEERGCYRVSAATAVGDALSLLNSDQPDLVILDAVMPGRHGFELAIEAARRSVPVMMMTGEPVMDGALDALGWTHLRKPFHLAELLAETRRTLAAAEQNLRMVRASLQKLSHTADEFHVILCRLCDVRRRIDETVRRSRREPPRDW